MVIIYIKNGNFLYFLKTKSDPNIHQNAPNYTIYTSTRHFIFRKSYGIWYYNELQRKNYSLFHRLG